MRDMATPFITDRLGAVDVTYTAPGSATVQSGLGIVNVVANDPHRREDGIDKVLEIEVFVRSGSFTGLAIGGVITWNSQAYRVQSAPDDVTGIVPLRAVRVDAEERSFERHRISRI